MKTVRYIFLLSVVAGGAFAQALAPELAPLAAKYKADVATLEAQRATALSQAQSVYTAALASAERSATTGSNVAAVAAINTERSALGSGLMPPGFPPGLPKELQRPRKAYLDAIDRIRTVEAPRRQAIDGAYLRSLTALEARAAKNPELAKQLKAEKEKLLASAPATAADTGKQNSKSAVVNGTFDLADAEGRPSGWAIEESFKIAYDGNNKIVHATAKEPGYHAITQDIPIPPKERTGTLSGRVRGKLTSRDQSQPHWGANIAGVFLDSEGQPTKTWIMLDGGNDTDWKTLTMTEKIPNKSKALRIMMVLKYVAGEFDYDDITVEFR